MALSPGIFREYDVRGVVGKDLDDAAVTATAKAFGTYLAKKGKKTAAVGRDVRHSSLTFAKLVADGLRSTGIDVIDAGIVPTPVLYYTIIQKGLDGGVMVTGSHNPIEYNGLKICEGSLALYGEEIQDLYRLASSGAFTAGRGNLETVDILPTYRDDLLSRFKPKRRFKVVVDTGNGVAGPLIPDFLKRLGHEVHELYTEPDGSFPNHLPDPEVPEYMADLVAKVREVEADIGLGFDGDADRLGVIDESGRKVSADWLVAIFARDLLARHPGGVVRFDVKCTDFLAADVRAHGGKPVMGRTGHSILKRDIKRLDAILGGELSGHIVFGREYYVIDDPFYCALKLLALIEASPERTCSGLFAGFPTTVSTAEIKVAVPEDKKFGVVADLTRDFAAAHEVTTVDGVRVAFADGWGLVRASNTTANLTVRFEARTGEALERIRKTFLERMSRYSFLELSKVRSAEIQ